ncbi:alanine racemase [Galbitalea sp. SE-J8]|uniref:alanine racemase n=1 Tax=Galbitalea sp. SE-J8 TaxID=3054952 RepID=UPI00259D2EC0|nr:alanine racemase [Galbitalea sp. SE-J8]MDM4763416.1 alanine racemase [Galbitalea sp. SE-J8]
MTAATLAALIATPPATQPWTEPARYWPALGAATAQLDPVFATVHVGALAHNADRLVARASGTPLRIASKSVRSRPILDAVLALPGWAGVLAYTLREALWLAQDSPGRPGITDVVVGYPTVDRGAIRALAADPALAARVTLMVDDVAQLDLIDAARREADGPGATELRVCLELDAGFDSRLLGFTGARRSPVHTVAQAEALARAIVGRPGFRLVGMMAYESQIAGTIDDPAGRPLYARAVRAMQRSSRAELADRRAAAVAAVRAIADLEFVNGGGTGSIESTSAESAVTDVAAGSGLFGPHLFDHYTAFSPAPAAAFVLPVVRKPAPGLATLLGGGWIASGPPGPDRLPRLEWPTGLAMLPREMAGEVQTPVSGPAAAALRVGDRVWARHTKAGELSEHVDELVLVDDDGVVGSVPTYRGEGKVFL